MDPLTESDTNTFSSPLLPTPEQKYQLRNLLHSNSLPRELSHFESVIASAPADLVRYDAAIERIQKLLDTVISDRETLQEYSDGCHSVLATVRRLPTEILGEIFARCAPEPMQLFAFWEHDTIRDNIARVSQLHLRRLSQVCASWHTTIMGTPSLWATIDVDLSYIQASAMTQITDLLSLSLQRSANSPLTIHLRAESQTAGPALELVAQHSARWRAADIYIFPQVFTYIAAAKGNLPLLELLEIGGSALDRLDIFDAAPKLTEVKISCFGADNPQLPWPQLQRVTYEYTGPTLHIVDGFGEGLQVMQQCSSACKFSLFDLDFTDQDFPIPHLTSVQSDISELHLSLSDDGGPEHFRQVLGELLAPLTLPSLQGLLFQAAVTRNPLFWPRAQFGAFFVRSSLRDTLQHLSLHDMIVTEDDLVECLSEMRVLINLHIEDVPSSGPGAEDHLLVTNSLLQRLTRTTDPTCLVPNLRIFAFSSLFTFDDSFLLAFVTSRLVPGQIYGQLFKLDMWWHPTTPAERDIDEAVAACMTELEGRNELVWSFHPIEWLYNCTWIISNCSPVAR
ncbi:hypothetical protein FB451DRAFT_1370494 [Mycena latifolia]|nr:hypothetical protein FB451DRAFT_1370494 [Mycena latifolia]